MSSPLSHWSFPHVRKAAFTFGAFVLVGGSVMGVGGDETSPALTFVAVRQGDVSATVGAAGSVQSGNVREVGFGTAGTVTKVNVSVGQTVKAGQVLATLDATQATENVNAAQAALGAANQAETNLANGVPSNGSGTGGSGSGGSGSGGSGSGGSGSGSGGSGSGGSGSGSGAAGSGGSGSGSGAAGSGGSGSGGSGSGGSGSGGSGSGGSGAGCSGSGGTGSGGKNGAGSGNGSGGGASATPTPRPSRSTRPTATPSGRPTGKPSNTPSARPTGNKGGGCGSGGNGGSGGSGSGGGAKGGTGSTSSGNTQTSQAQADANLLKAQVQLAQAQQALRGTEIIAPTAGTILSVAGTVGTVVNGPGSSGFVTIGDLNEYQVQADFSESDVAKLKIGQPATISLAAGNGGPYQGTVSGIAPSATTTGNLVQFGVEIAFDDQPANLLIGQTATVQVTVQQATDTLYVPNNALRTTPNGDYQVVVRSKDGSPRLRTVKLGLQGDQDAEVVSGLLPGDRIETT